VTAGSERDSRRAFFARPNPLARRLLYGQYRIVNLTLAVIDLEPVNIGVGA